RRGLQGLAALAADLLVGAGGERGQERPGPEALEGDQEQRGQREQGGDQEVESHEHPGQDQGQGTQGGPAPGGGPAPDGGEASPPNDPGIGPPDGGQHHGDQQGEHHRLAQARREGEGQQPDDLDTDDVDPGLGPDDQRNREQGDPVDQGQQRTGQDRRFDRREGHRAESAQGPRSADTRGLLQGRVEGPQRGGDG